MEMGALIFLNVILGLMVVALLVMLGREFQRAMRLESRLRALNVGKVPKKEVR